MKKSNQSGLSKQSKKRQGAPSLARAVVATCTRHGMSRAEAKLKCGHAMIVSVGTERVYRNIVKCFIQYLRKEKNKDWCQVSVEDFEEYLRVRSHRVQQKTLDNDRRAFMTVCEIDLPYFKSKIPTVVVPRAYTREQIVVLIAAACPALALLIAIAASAGLRASELLTIAPISVLSEHERGWLASRFSGRGDEYQLFVVVGKGGLRRLVAIHHEIAKALMERLLPAKREVRNNEIYYKQYFDLRGGNTYSREFSALSKKLFGYSTGAHGVRHFFAQLRIVQLQQYGFDFNQTLDVAAQELGHFSHSNTLKYLR